MREDVYNGQICYYFDEYVGWWRQKYAKIISTPYSFSTDGCPVLDYIPWHLGCSTFPYLLRCLLQVCLVFQLLRCCLCVVSCFVIGFQWVLLSLIGSWWALLHSVTVCVGSSPIYKSREYNVYSEYKLTF